MAAQPCEYIKAHWTVYFEFYGMWIISQIFKNNGTFSERDLGYTGGYIC